MAQEPLVSIIKIIQDNGDAYFWVRNITDNSYAIANPVEFNFTEKSMETPLPAPTFKLTKEELEISIL